jgi:CheY-like chemotaxis protein
MRHSVVPRECFPSCSRPSLTQLDTRRQPIDALIVDDESPLRELIRSFLELEGYVVQTACDGLHALEQLAQYSPRFVLVDVNMPRMNGIEFVRTLQMMPEGRAIAPIFLTSDFTLSPQGHGLGEIPVLPKPFDFCHLLSTIQTLTRASVACVAG